MATVIARTGVGKSRVMAALRQLEAEQAKAGRKAARRKGDTPAPEPDYAASHRHAVEATKATLRAAAKKPAAKKRAKKK